MQWLIPILAQAAALTRVRSLPGSRYGWFSVYLAAMLTQSVALWMLKLLDHVLYSWVWYYSEPVIDALWVAMAAELYGHISALYPGMGRKRWALTAIGLALLATWATLVEPHSTRIQNIELLRRVTATILAFAMVLLGALFGYFRNSLPRNAVIHAAVMACYFLTQAVGFLGENLDRNSSILNWGVSVAGYGAISCYAAWALLLTPAGEIRPGFTSPFTPAELEAADDASLDEITRTSRRLARGRGNSGD